MDELLNEIRDELRAIRQMLAISTRLYAFLGTDEDDELSERFWATSSSRPEDWKLYFTALQLRQRNKASEDPAAELPGV